MKIKTVLFLLITVALLVLVGCSDDDKKSSVTGSGLTDNVNYAIVFDPVTHFAAVQSKVAVESCTLTINNEEVTLGAWTNYVDPEDPSGFSWFAYAFDLPADLDLSAGSELNFMLNINGNANSSILVVQSVPVIEFPEFDINQDYSLNWELETSATVQSVDFDLDLFDLQNGTDINVSVSNDIVTSLREYTFSNSLYSQYTSWEVSYLYASLDLSNYAINGDLLVMSFISVSNEEDKATTIDNSSKYKRMLKSILADQ